MKQSKATVVAMSLIYVFLLIICRGVYLFVGEKKTILQSLLQVAVEVGNFAVIAVLGLAVAFAFIFIGARFSRKTQGQK
jgi:hypothetical protein